MERNREIETPMITISHRSSTEYHPLVSKSTVQLFQCFILSSLRPKMISITQGAQFCTPPNNNIQSRLYSACQKQTFNNQKKIYTGKK